MGNEELNEEDRYAAKMMGISEERAKEIKGEMRKKGIVHVVCPRCGYSFWGEIGETYECIFCGTKVKV
jgi:hypothetical protein